MRSVTVSGLTRQQQKQHRHMPFIQVTVVQESARELQGQMTKKREESTWVGHPLFWGLRGLHGRLDFRFQVRQIQSWFCSPLNCVSFDVFLQKYSIVCCKIKYIECPNANSLMWKRACIFNFCKRNWIYVDLNSMAANSTSWTAIVARRCHIWHLTVTH